MTARRTRTILSAVVLALGLAPAAAARTLVFCPAGAPEGFDPAPYVLGATYDASAQPIYDRLVAYSPGTTEIVPALAESWDISRDGLEYTFHLRQDVPFHATASFTPTRPLNADDVVFSFERQWDTGNPFFDYAGGEWPYFAGMSLPSALRAVRKVDDETVAFVLLRPDASFLATLAMDFASILSKEYADQIIADGTREALNGEPVGTGPFKLVSNEPGERVRYAANPDYWGGRPAIDDLVFDITPDAAVRLAKLRHGECDVIAEPPPEIEAQAAQSPVRILRAPGAGVAYLAYNTSAPPFDRSDVRKALAMAVDKDAIIQAVYLGDATRAASPLSPAFGAHDPSLGGAYDPRVARERLAATGVGDIAFPIRVLSIPRSYNPHPLRAAEILRDQLAAIGVDSEVAVYDDSEIFLGETADSGRAGVALLGWTSDNGDPDNVLAPLLGCDVVGISNHSQWCDPRFDKLIRQAKVETAEEVRAALYRQAQAIFADAAPWIPIAHPDIVAAVRDGVGGVTLTPFGRFRFDQAEMSDN